MNLTYLSFVKTAIFNPSLYAEIQEAKKPLNDDNTGEMVTISASTSLTISGNRFSNFLVKDNKISFTVDTSEAKGDFTNYYMETYDRSGNLLERIPILSTSISGLDITYTNVKLISISHYESGVYPNVVLNDSTLTCTKDNEVYKYKFFSGGVSVITYSLSVKETTENQEEYYNLLNKYTTEAAFGKLNGVERSLLNTEDGFTFTKEVNLQLAPTNDLEYGFAYNTKANQIAFEMSTKGYKCN